MALKQPSGYGVIVRKSSQTAPYVEAKVRAMSAAAYPVEVLEDAHLVAFTLARSWQDARLELASLVELGCREDIDFVVTAPQTGAWRPLPPWLAMELLPTGNPPELTAKMTPEVRQMWEDNRQRAFSFVANASQSAASS